MAHAFFRKKGEKEMAQKVVDISKYINNDAPQMVLFGKTYTVNNDKKTVLLLNELQRKAQEKQENNDDKIIELLVGKEDGKEICRIINESANYAENAKVIMLNLLALATGQPYEELEKRFQKASEQ
mgnify:FL=1